MDSIHEEISQGSTLRTLWDHSRTNTESRTRNCFQLLQSEIPKDPRWTEWSVDPWNREKAVIGDFGDFHNPDFDFTFEDVMMFELQNIQDDFPIQIQHQDFENMR